MKKLFLLISMLLAASTLSSQIPGYLDYTFGDGGQAMYAIGASYDKAEDVVIQPDGKMIISGCSRQINGNNALAFIRLNSDGTLDDSFGNGGFSVIQSTNYYGNFIMKSHVLDDGKIIGTGYYYSSTITNTLIVRLNSDGTLDTSFGNNGIVLGTGSEEIAIESSIIQDDGKIILTGYADDQITTIRYNSDGSLDNTYGDNGKFVLHIDNVAYSFVKDIAIQTDGKVVLGGFFTNYEGVYNCIVVRVNTDGTIDETFGNIGYMTHVIGDGHNFVSGIDIQSDGKIVFGGHFWTANIPALQYSFFVMRLNTNGSIDNTYGENGIASAKLISSGENYTLDLIVSADDKTYSAGYTVEGSNIHASIVSFDKNGVLNAAFDGGMVSSTFGQDGDYIRAIDIQDDGKIVIAGFTYLNDGSDFIIERFDSDIDVDGISDNGNLFDNAIFSVYPNPTSDMFYIHSDNNDVVSVIITDISGRVVLTQTTTPETSVNVSELPSGNYFVTIKNNYSVVSKKLTKL